ncbi:MAG: hypothetical protein OWT27_00540 [Firmicutes bacterium]|nr:hypothetical protein [Bacillota bacterium]
MEDGPSYQDETYYYEPPADNSPLLVKMRRYGQSPWLDHLRRDLFSSGTLEERLQMGIGGVLTNPDTMFNCIVRSPLYDDEIMSLGEQGASEQQIYETIQLYDAQRAADLLTEVHETSWQDDGYVSIQISPLIADDAQAIANEAQRLRTLVGRPNVMIAIPVTDAGLQAAVALMADGVAVQLSMNFSRRDYARSWNAHVTALQRRVQRGAPLAGCVSVASVLVNRIELGAYAVTPEHRRDFFFGRSGLAVPRTLYRDFLVNTSAADFCALRGMGAHTQRLMFAGTGVPDPGLQPCHYMDNLIAPYSIQAFDEIGLTTYLEGGHANRMIPGFPGPDGRCYRRLREVGVELEDLDESLRTQELRDQKHRMRVTLDAITRIMQGHADEV